MPDPIADTCVTVPQLLALIREAAGRGVWAQLTHDVRTLSMTLTIEGRQWWIGANHIRAHYARQLPLPAGAEVRDGWIAQRLPLSELLSQRSAETRQVSRLFGADLHAARRGEPAGGGDVPASVGRAGGRG